MKKQYNTPEWQLNAYMVEDVLGNGSATSLLPDYENGTDLIPQD